MNVVVLLQQGGSLEGGECFPAARGVPDVAVAGVVLVVDDLLHGPARADAKSFQLDLDAGNSIDEDENIVPVVAVVRVDAELVNDLEVVFAPVLDVDEGVVQRRAIVPGEVIDLAKGLGCGEDIRSDDFIEQAGELAIGQVDAVERFEFLPEVLFQCGAVADVRAVFVFEAAELLDEPVLDVLFPDDRGALFRREIVNDFRYRHGAFDTWDSVADARAHDSSGGCTCSPSV